MANICHHEPVAVIINGEERVSFDYLQAKDEIVYEEIVIDAPCVQVFGIAEHRKQQVVYSQSILNEYNERLTELRKFYDAIVAMVDRKSTRLNSSH